MLSRPIERISQEIEKLQLAGAGMTRIQELLDVENQFFQAPSKHGDCLATCAETVLTYLGGSLKMVQIFKALKLRANLGTPFSNIQKLEKLNILVGYRQHGSLEILYRNGA